jgi:signal transduction histidine kinase
MIRLPSSRSALRDLYIAAVLFAATSLFLCSVHWTTGDEWNLVGALGLFGAMLVAERLSVFMPHEAQISIATIPHMMAVLLLPPWMSMLLAGGSMLVDQLAARARWRKALFNLGSILLSVGLSAVVADSVGLGREGLTQPNQWQQAPAFLLVVATYYCLTNGLLAMVMALDSGQPAHRIFLENARFALPAELAVCGVGGLLTVVWLISPAWTPMILSPVLVSQVALSYIASSKRTNARLAFLAEASNVLALSLDESELPGRITRLAVPTLADTCLLFLAREDGSLAPAAHAPDDSASEAELSALDLGPWVRHLLAEKQSVLVGELHKTVPIAGSPEVQQRDALTRLGFHSLIGIPFLPGDQRPGVLVFLRSGGSPAYKAADLAFAEELARRGGIAIDKARLHAEAKEATRLRDEFLSVAAHELKTPMTSLRGYAQLLLSQAPAGSTPLDADVLTKGLRIIATQSEKLTQLTSQLLDVSRIEAGKLQLDRRQVDLSALIRSVAAAAQANTERHSLHLDVPETCEALVDPLRLEQVVTNLLSNAIKYSPDGGQIELAIVPCATGAIRVEVRDHGIGIPPERRAHVFERFYQAHGEGHFGGLGLGLFISRQIAELHGGSLEADFPSDGGTRFIVTLPAPTAPSSAPVPEQRARLTRGLVARSPFVDVQVDH